MRYRKQLARIYLFIATLLRLGRAGIACGSVCPRTLYESRPFIGPSSGEGVLTLY